MEEDKITVQATRGVVVGVGDSMRGPVYGEPGKNGEPAQLVKAGEIRALPAETAKYLKAIGAVTDKIERPGAGKA